MNKILKNRKVLFTMFAIVILLMSIVGIVFATSNKEIDETRKASLTITEYERSDSQKLVGAQFTLYPVLDTIENVEDAKKYIKDKGLDTYVKTVPNTGSVKFSDLNLGKYLVVETKAPENATNIVESFLIDLPAFDKNDINLNYDVVVYPKIVGVYGDAKVTQLDQNGDKVTNCRWILEKYEKGKWQESSRQYYDSEENSIIKINNLEIGKYRIYIWHINGDCLFDASHPFVFEVDANHMSHEFEYVAEKILVNKQILLDSGKYGKYLGSDLSKRNTWKITADIPTFIDKMDRYDMIEYIDEGLVIDNKSIHVYGIDEKGKKTEIVDNAYKLNESYSNITIKLNVDSIVGLKKVIVTYETAFKDNIKNGEFSNCTILQSNQGVKVNGDKGEYISLKTMTRAKVYVGSLLVKKVNELNKPLSGAKFKIATSRENAEKGVFVKNRSNDDMVAISNENGDVIFNGLKYGNDDEAPDVANSSYWIVETESPTYEKNGETRHYEILKDSIEVNVNNKSGTYSDDTATVVNKKSFILPLTGKSFSIILLILGIIFVLSSIIILKRKDSFQNNSDVERE